MENLIISKVPRNLRETLHNKQRPIILLIMGFGFLHVKITRLLMLLTKELYNVPISDEFIFDSCLMIEEKNLFFEMP